MNFWLREFVTKVIIYGSSLPNFFPHIRFTKSSIIIKWLKRRGKMRMANAKRNDYLWVKVNVYVFLETAWRDFWFLMFDSEMIWDIEQR